ncbi:MAG: Fimbrial assembly family protein, partial [Frankiales bacterium]|nr:Fimbrial assembly family protein [Frankiales bacterium]
MTIDTLVQAPVTLPRVNLLPQEANAADAARRVKLMLGLAMAAVLGGVGYMNMAAGASVSAAQTDLDTAQAQTRTLKNQIAQHSSITPLKTEVESRNALLATAMAMNVPWATYLNDVQLTLPRGARLVSWQIQLAAATPGAPSTGFASNGVASWTITGEAKRFEDVALVMESLQRLSQVDSVLVTQASEGIDSISGKSLVTFT